MRHLPILLLLLLLAAPVDPSTLSGVSMKSLAWTPADLPDLHVWYRGDTYDADPVGSWTDKSGNGYHATQSTESRKPDVVSEAQMDNQSCLQWTDDAEDEHLLANWTNLTEPFTIAFALDWNGAGMSIPTVYWDETKSVGAVGAGSNRLSVNNIYATDVDSFPNGGHYVEVSYNGASGDVYIDGAVAGSGSPSATTFGAAITLGDDLPAGSYPVNMSMCEFIVVDDVLTSDERTSLEAYFAARYGL